MIRSTQDQLRDIREESDSPFAVTLIDVCLSDYLQDHHHRDGELLLGVPVDGSATVGAVMEGLLDEFRTVAWDLGESRKGYDHDKAKAAVKALILHNMDNAAQRFDSSLPEPPDESRFTHDDGEPDEDAFDEAEREWEMAETCFAWFLIHWDVPDEDEEGGDGQSLDS